MTFIPLNTRLIQAIEEKNAQQVEKLILDCDYKSDLIKQYVREKGKSNLVSLLPQFKSKGLVLNIKDFLDI